AFGAIGLLCAPLWPASVFAAAFFLAALTFHVGRAAYYVEMAPWLILLAVAGAEIAVRAPARLRNRALAIAAVCALSLPALWTGLKVVDEFGALMSGLPRHRSRYRLYEPAFAELRRQRAVVFLHYP